MVPEKLSRPIVFCQSDIQKEQNKCDAILHHLDLEFIHFFLINIYIYMQILLMFSLPDTWNRCTKISNYGADASEAIWVASYVI